MLLLHARGFAVTGSTLDRESQAAQLLIRKGIEVVPGYQASRMSKNHIVVYPRGIASSNEELKEARRLAVPVLLRGQMLAELVRHQYTIAVAGSYGKTMTTALIGHLLADTGWQPTVLTNEVMRNIKSTLLHGKSEWAIIEADESDKSLLYLQPTIALVNSIEHRHLHTYTDLAAMIEAFTHFLEPIPFYGTAVLNYDDTHTRNLRRNWHGNAVTYGLSANCQMRGHIVDLASDHSIVNVSDKDEGLLGTITLPLVGSHNVRHAMGAIAVCYKVLDIPFAKIEKSLQRFAGVARRFAHMGSCNGARVIDDHACHPTTVEEAIVAAQKCTTQKLHIMFQPFDHQDTKEYWDRFIALFGKHQKHIGSVHILPIYDPSQPTDDHLKNCELAAAISEHAPDMKLFCYQEAHEAIAAVRSCATRGDVVLTMGRGPVAHISEQLVQKS